MALQEPIQVVINAKAGASDKDEVVARMAELYPPDDRRCRVSVAKNGSDVVDITTRAVKDNYQTIIAGGGDGTISSVAGVLAGTGRILGVLPLGTLNHFAKDLQIPLDIEGALNTIVASNIMQVDVGEVNGRFFLNNSSLGLYPRIVREREKQQRLGWGKWTLVGQANEAATIDGKQQLPIAEPEFNSHPVPMQDVDRLDSCGRLLPAHEHANILPGLDDDLETLLAVLGGKCELTGAAAAHLAGEEYVTHGV